MTKKYITIINNKYSINENIIIKLLKKININISIFDS